MNAYITMTTPPRPDNRAYPFRSHCEIPVSIVVRNRREITICSGEGESGIYVAFPCKTVRVARFFRENDNDSNERSGLFRVRWYGGAMSLDVR